MLNIIKSSAQKPNSALRQSKRKPDEDNLTWLRRHLTPNEERLHLVLLGGADALSFRLRVAQSHLRHDLTPSRWSHALLLDGATVRAGKDNMPPALTNVRTFEISLDPAQGFGFTPPTNALQHGRLRDHTDVTKFPNIALLSAPVAWAQAREMLVEVEAKGTGAKRGGFFQHQRAVLDATELVILWLAYVWGVGRASNPLLEGHGIPSAAMIEVVLGAAGFDLTPGLESRASCPEAIWQSAKWWHEYHNRDVQPVAPAPTDSQPAAPSPTAAAAQQDMALVGFWYAPHELISE